MFRKMSHEAISVNQKASVVRPGVCHHARNDLLRRWYHLSRGGITIHVFLGGKRDMINNFSIVKIVCIFNLLHEDLREDARRIMKTKTDFEKIDLYLSWVKLWLLVCWTFARHPSPVTRYPPSAIRYPSPIYLWAIQQTSFPQGIKNSSIYFVLRTTRWQWVMIKLSKSFPPQT